jgi:hypothetical protein
MLVGEAERTASPQFVAIQYSPAACHDFFEMAMA